jgi:hypothetical protein
MHSARAAYRKDLKSISIDITRSTFAASEKAERFAREMVSENSLRVFGAFTVSLAVAVCAVVPMAQLAGIGASVALCAVLGLVVYVLGSRGFRRQITLDARNARIILSRMNARNHDRFQRIIPLDEVLSVFVRRPEQDDRLASLCLRVAGRAEPITALTGHPDEIERLIADIRRIAKKDPTQQDDRARHRD